MYTIEVDYSVYRKLILLRDTEDVSFNEIINNLLNKQDNKNRTHQDSRQTKRPFITKKTYFPHGTRFTGATNGQKFETVVDNGCLLFNGKQFHSFSSAGVAACGHSVNGWSFWNYLEDISDDEANRLTIKTQKNHTNTSTDTPKVIWTKTSESNKAQLIIPASRFRNVNIYQDIGRQPCEEDPFFKRIERKINSELEEIFQYSDKGMGFCHTLWAEKAKTILRRYGFIWYSPAEINPHIIYD